jgi:hypothetical protein
MDIFFCIKGFHNPKRVYNFCSNLYKIIPIKGKKKQYKWFQQEKKWKRIRKISCIIFSIHRKEKSTRNYFYRSQWFPFPGGNECVLETGSLLCHNFYPADTGMPVGGLNSPLKLVGVDALRASKPVLLGDKFTCSKARNWSSEG